ncbi:hypothetical protein ACE38W_18195 [Chitinophaga sp. Hz27]|uniref:hypothetical protein n=1 Tax=Chitinophaga sp. Hz27 TaxID=3347169 RepID=UPI0035DA2DDD
MKKHNILNETDHSRTYLLIRKEFRFACRICGWSSDFYRPCPDRKERFSFFECDENMQPIRKVYGGYYSWKLVSKNRKQWMKKRFISLRKSRFYDPALCRLGW